MKKKKMVSRTLKWGRVDSSSRLVARLRDVNNGTAAI